MFGLTPFERSSYDLFDAFHNFENDFFGENNAMQTFKTDIRDEGDKFVMEAELPGFDKEDIALDLADGRLVLSAEHKTENNQNDGKYIRRERTYGSYRRSFDVSDVDCDKIEAEYKNGILMLTLPKKQQVQPQAKRLEIK